MQPEWGFMSLRALPKPNKNWAIFPATKTVAFYAPESSLIELSDICSADLTRAFAQSDPICSYQILPLFMHEIRHWFDHTSTLWGRQRLASLFDALSARSQNKPEEFWRIVSYRRLLREDMRADYFSTVGDTPAPTPSWPWKAQSTMGDAFDSNGRLDESVPIPFANFYWPNDKKACRVPLSVAALLETNAVCFEILAALSLMQQLPEETREVEQRLADKKWISQMYNPEFGVYSAAAHLAANKLRISNPAEAYCRSSALASVALNIPTARFDAMVIPGLFETWGKKNYAALRQRNRGYAYLVLVHHSLPVREVQNIDEWLEETLRSAGLPDLCVLRTEALTEMKDIGSNLMLIKPYRARFDLLQEVGNENFGILGVHPTIDVVLNRLSDLHLCPIVTADLEWTFIGKQNTLQVEEDADGWWNLVFDLLRQFTEFTEACR